MNDFYEGYHAERQRFDNFDHPLRDVVDDYIKFFNISDDDSRGMLESILYWKVVSDYSGSLKDMSLKTWNWDSYYEGEFNFISGPGGGFKRLIDHYAKPLLSKIRLESKVISIDYTEIPVQVVYEDADGNTRIAKARKVLSTLPVGVLKAG